jgi:hypothetical protein
MSGLILGGTRLPQLFINFVAFFVFQIAVFQTGQFIGRRRVISYALLGLVLCQATPWFRAGGLFDFRIAFFAYCFYGIWVCQVIRSNLLLDRRIAIWTAFIGAFLILHRFLTVIYLVGVCIGFAAVCVSVSFFRRSHKDLVSRTRRRLRNIILSIGIMGALVAPILIINRAAIHGYYVIGHVVGPEKDIRARGLDVTGHLLYYPKSILTDHLGPSFLWGSAVLIVCALITFFLARRHSEKAVNAAARDETFFLSVIFLTGAVLGPIVVLTADIAKSPIVGGVIGVPTALLVLVVVARSIPRDRELNPSFIDKFVIAFSLGIFGLGLANEFHYLNRHLPQYAQINDLERLAALDKWLVDYASEQHWNRPGISFDATSDWFLASAITASGYEQSRKLIAFHQMLGASLMGVERSEALSLLKNSDFVILTTQPRQGMFPFDEKIAKYWNDLKLWADTNMVLARSALFDRFTATVYTHPSARISGISGGWITSSGLTIETLRASLRQFPEIRLVGSAFYAVLPREPAVTAMVKTDQEMQSIPASFRHVGRGYEILIDTSTLRLSLRERVQIQLNFDSFFVQLLPKRFTHPEGD